MAMNNTSQLIAAPRNPKMLPGRYISYISIATCHWIKYQSYKEIIIIFKKNSNLQVFNKQLDMRLPKLVVPKRKGPHGLYMHTWKLFFCSEILSYSSMRWIVTQIQEGIEGLTSKSEDAVLLKISASCLRYLTSQIYLVLFLGKKDKIQGNKHRCQLPFLGTAGFLNLSLILFKISPAGLVGTNTSAPWASILLHKNQ